MKNEKKTHLYDEHLRSGGKMTNFHGWQLPVYYGSIVKEYSATRQGVGVFDVSHMGEFLVDGNDSATFLSYVLSINVGALAQGRARYALMLNEQGGIIDDLTVYCLQKNQSYQLCVNSANEQKDWQHLLSVAKSFDVNLQNISADVSLLAVQGAQAAEVLARVHESLAVCRSLPYYGFARLTYGGSPRHLIARMGYTGEDGFEWFMPNDLVVPVWRALLEAGCACCGLGARDILRLEMGFCLHGSDIDETTDPLCAGLDWAVRNENNFIGKQALDQIGKGTIEKQRQGIMIDGPSSPRHGDKIYAEQTLVGTVCSGAFSPSLQKGIAMAYLPVHIRATQELRVHSGSRILPARRVAFPFIETPAKPLLPPRSPKTRS